MSEQENASQVTPEQQEEVVEQQPEFTLESALAELDAARVRMAELQEQALRVSAEMQNVRRRAERDVEGAHKYALEKFGTDLLPVIDSLERGLQAAAGDSLAAVREGIELTLRMFSDVLRKHGLEAVDSVGEPFNPALHEAMSMQPNADYPPNTVIMVLQKGYTLNGRLVRPAMVIVSAAVS